MISMPCLRFKPSKRKFLVRNYCLEEDVILLQVSVALVAVESCAQTELVSYISFIFIFRE